MSGSPLSRCNQWRWSRLRLRPAESSGIGSTGACFRIRGQMRKRHSYRGCTAALLLSLLAWLGWPSESEAVPRAADKYKRQFLGAYREVIGLDHPALLGAQVEAESAWIDGQVSSARARGLCQFIEPTALGIEKQNPGLGALGRYSPAWCARAQAYLMRDLFTAFGYKRTPCSGWLISLAGYNGSPSTLRKEILMCDATPGCDSNRWFEHIATQRARAWVHWNESRAYVMRIFSRETDYVAAGWGASVCH